MIALCIIQQFKVAHSIYSPLALTYDYLKYIFQRIPQFVLKKDVQIVRAFLCVFIISVIKK